MAQSNKGQKDSMTLVDGSIYLVNGYVCKVLVKDNTTCLIRVNEEIGDTLADVPTGEKLGFVQLPEGWMSLIQGGPLIQEESETEPPITDAPGPAEMIFLEHLADSTEEYVRRRAMGYYKLKDRHVYRYQGMFFMAYKPPDEPYIIVLYLLDPATYELVERKPYAFYGCIKIGDDVWRQLFLAEIEPVAANLTTDDLEYVGEAATMIDNAVDDRFKEIMGEFNW